MPLNYRIVIEPQRKSISLWDGARFICEYPFLRMEGISLNSGKTVIASRRATIAGANVSPTAKNYRAASKSIVLKSPPVQISPYDADDETTLHGISLSQPDIEELFLLTRTGNEVEIRNPKK